LTLVASDGGHLAALGQTVPRESGYHVAQLLVNAHLGAEAETETLASLLGALAQAAGQRQTTRLYARVERDAAANEAFALAGFSPYKYESVYWLPHPLAEKPESNLPVRPQESKDAWGIYQLYCSVTPRVVQQAEDTDASYWEIPSTSAGRALQNVGEDRWILEVDNCILGYVRTSRLSRRLSLMIHPGGYPYARRLIGFALDNLRPPYAIRCSLPEYQGGLEEALGQLGFQYVGTQAALVRQIAGAVRAENRAIRHVLEPTRGPVHTASGH